MPLQRARLRISDYNSNRKHRVKDSERKIAAASLPLTSMVDMFTTLVVYMLLLSGDMKAWVDMEHQISLPKARAKWGDANRGATIQVSQEAVFAEGNVTLIPIDKLARAPFSVPEIKDYLKKLEKKDGYVNIVADERVDFGHIRKIVASCGDAGFRNVNLAVQPQ